MKDILIIATGGTIASRRGKNGLSPVIDANELVSYVPKIAELCNISCLSPFSLDSTNIRPVDWLKLADIIKRNYDKYDGFVICHGTDTMAYTSAALSYLIQNSYKPIVITGAQRPIDMEITDAKTNLIDSVVFALQDKAHGVCMVFDGKVICATRAKKQRTKSYNAFSSVNYPNIARIIDERVVFYIDDKCEEQPVFYNSLEPGVFLLKLIPGIDAEFINYIASKYKGLIIESFGLGGLPDYNGDKKIAAAIKKFTEGGGIVVISTQVPNEGSDMTVYEVGSSVKNGLNIIEAYDMTTEAAVTKLMWLLSNFSDYSEIESNFYREINHDILMA